MQIKNVKYQNIFRQLCRCTECKASLACILEQIKNLYSMKQQSSNMYIISFEVYIRHDVKMKKKSARGSIFFRIRIRYKVLDPDDVVRG